MTDRDQAITALLSTTPWASWRVDWLDPDASTRRYARLTSPIAETAILMDLGPAPRPDAYVPFLAIASYLRGQDLCAPATLLNRASDGVLVIQDLGRDTISRWLNLHPHEEEVIYTAAVTLLAGLVTVPVPPGLIALNPTRAAGMIAPLFEHYATGLDARTEARIIGALQAALATHAPDPTTLALRDFHAENLIWRANRVGPDRIGLLDFQDAVLAPPEYDLASLLRDARRDVDPEMAVRMIDLYARLTVRPVAQVLASVACLAVQRNLRIIGIFARLAATEGKRRYLALIPRLCSHILQDLQHPALADLAPLIRDAISPPRGAQ